MIKGLFFDFDGTLCDLVEVHYSALNNAIRKVSGDSFIISKEDQDKFYNGLSTKTKLQKLVADKGLPVKDVALIAQLKQKYTLEAINHNIGPNLQLHQDLKQLKSEGYIIYCASNALVETVELGLKNMGVAELFDYILGNDAVKRQKPAPDMYLQCFVHAGLDPKECLIIEDSKHGREAAVRSGAYVCSVDNETQTTYQHIKESIDKYSKKISVPWKDSRLNVLIPMAGGGSRFKEAGFLLPKPLIDVNGKPMIQVVVENLNIDANFIFIVQKSHYEQYNLGILLPLIAPGCQIVQVDGLTEGAACTTLLAKDLIDNEKHLLIANSDQYCEWDSCDFMSSMLASDVDGGILTFKSNETKWSYAKTDSFGYVNEVAEKKVISEDATVGIYYFGRGSDYVRLAEQMIQKEIKINNEYYVCPVYNEAIAENKKIKIYPVCKQWGLGVPADLELFLKHHEE